MKQVLIRGGEVFVEDVPAPVVAYGCVLVRTAFSAISSGTELTGIKHAATPLWERALKEPEKIKQAVSMAAQRGVKNTYSLITDKLSSGNPVGYSLSGTVIEAGDGVGEFRVGDKVACGGNKYAYHSEIITVPKNLVVKVPDGMDMSAASTATIGAIALQGVRRAMPTIGEVFCVIGLGILGQLTVQILRANGCVVIGTDVDSERTALALTLGMQHSLEPEQGEDALRRLSHGYGVDGVIITASTASDSLISKAFKMCRKKGRVVLVGDVGLSLNRGDFYEKELDFFISTSYGPGRYDGVYEEQGLDYPIGYVRWTENRNMSEFLRLVATGLIKLDPLISKTFPLEDAKQAYEQLKNSDSKPLIVLLSYPQTDSEALRRVVFSSNAKPIKTDRVRIALAGCGSFARAVHLPNLRDLKNLYHLRAIMNRTGHVAKNSAKQFAADYSTTDYTELLKDETIDAVLIATTHSLHAKMAYDALCAGKHVFVEKPLAITKEDLSLFSDFYRTVSQSAAKPLLMVGFNRRFSLHIQKVKKLTEKRTGPLIITYRINGGFIASDNWIQTGEGGGRNLGEACHIYDIFTFLTNSRVKTIEAMSITPLAGYYMRNDNFTTLMTFEDGSVCTLTYTSMGSRDYPKERMEVFFDGKTVVLDDYKITQIFGAHSDVLKTKTAEKGHKEELTAFAKLILSAAKRPMELWELFQATGIALRVEELISS